MKRLIMLLACLLSIGAATAADNYTSRLNYLGEGDVNAAGITSSSGRISSVRCHCTGSWAPAPELEVVSLNTGEAYASAVCDTGPNPATNSKVNIPPQHGPVQGTHLGFRVGNSPRPVREAGQVWDFHACSATARVK